MLAAGTVENEISPTGSMDPLRFLEICQAYRWAKVLKPCFRRFEDPEDGTVSAAQALAITREVLCSALQRHSVLRLDVNMDLLDPGLKPCTLYLEP